MDGPPTPQAGLDRLTTARDPRSDTAAAGPGTGEGAASPVLTLDGFTGPLDHLLTLARARTIDLATISLTALLDQLAAALRQAPAATALGQKADWVVMAAWLVQLRSRLLLPADAPARRAATAAADQLRRRLVALAAMQALAGWLDRRPQLGHAVFARGRPEVFGLSVEAGEAIDGVEFLWASLALFDDPRSPATTTPDRPRRFEPHTVAAACDRIRRRLAETPDGAPLARFLPDPPDPAEPGEPATWRQRRRRSAWSSTLIAGLELARQGEVTLRQARDFEPIHLAPADTGRPDGQGLS